VVSRRRSRRSRVFSSCNAFECSSEIDKTVRIARSRSSRSTRASGSCSTRSASRLSVIVDSTSISSESTGRVNCVCGRRRAQRPSAVTSCLDRPGVRLEPGIDPVRPDANRLSAADPHIPEPAGGHLPSQGGIAAPRVPGGLVEAPPPGGLLSRRLWGGGYVCSHEGRLALILHRRKVLCL